MNVQNVHESLNKLNKSNKFTISQFAMGFTTVVIISTVLFFSLNSSKKDQLSTTSTEEAKGNGKFQENQVSKTVYGDQKTATILRDSIILVENKKNTSMKSLDSLAALFLVSTNILFDTALQPTTDQRFTTYSYHKDTLVEKIEPLKDNQVTYTQKAIAINEIESGTFYANKLFWFKENYAVYFKGKVKVNFGGNDFSGTGTFNFLDPVYLLVINDTPASFNDNISLSNNPYRLIRLDSEAATKKYGEKGYQGAVEISVITE